MKKIALIAMLGVFAAGCVGLNNPSRIAVLQNPATKQTVDCRADPGGSFSYRSQIESCVSTYQKAGYRLVADSAD